MCQAMSYPIEMLTLQTLYQRMDPNHYLKGLNTKDGEVQHVSFETDKKSAFFSSVGGGIKKLESENLLKHPNLHFSHLWGLTYIF